MINYQSQDRYPLRNAESIPLLNSVSLKTMC